MRSNNVKKTVKLTWWLSPLFLIGFLLIILLLSAQKDEIFFAQYRVARQIGNDYVLVVSVLLLFFFLGCVLSLRRKSGSKSRARFSIKTVQTAAFFLAGLTIFGYLVWAVRFVSYYGFLFPSPNMLSAIFRNKRSISGITTCTQFGVIAVPVLVYLIKENSQKRKNAFFLILLFLLAGLRAYVFSERLALVELFIPLLISSLFVFRPKRKRIKFFVALLPLVMVVSLFIFFAVFEYFRSWTYYRDYYASFYTFIYDRLIAYYAMATNTNAGLFNSYNGPTFPAETFEFLLLLPNASSLSRGGFIEYGDSFFSAEFNNPGALASLYLDFGYLGFFLAFLFGLLTGRLYKMAAKGNPIGISGYSLAFLALLELPRYFYIGNTRAVYPVFGFLLIALMVRRPRRIHALSVKRGNYGIG